MKYIIYEPANKAEIRHQQITDDAHDASFLPLEIDYDAIIRHPTEDKAALVVTVTDPFYYQDMPYRGYDYSIFFTAQEMAKAVDVLPIDWVTNETNNI